MDIICKVSCWLREYCLQYGFESTYWKTRLNHHNFIGIMILHKKFTRFLNWQLWIIFFWKLLQNHCGFLVFSTHCVWCRAMFNFILPLLYLTLYYYHKMAGLLEMHTLGFFFHEANRQNEARGTVLHPGPDGAKHHGSRAYWRGHKRHSREREGKQMRTTILTNRFLFFNLTYNKYNW